MPAAFFCFLSKHLSDGLFVGSLVLDHGAEENVLWQCRSGHPLRGNHSVRADLEELDGGGIVRSAGNGINFCSSSLNVRLGKLECLFV
jgi:hypothetical protein